MPRDGIRETKRLVQANVPWRVFMLLRVDADRRGESVSACLRRHLERSLALGIAPDEEHQT